MVTVVVDAVSYLLSAFSLKTIGDRSPHADRPGATRVRAGDLLDGWRHLLAHPGLRPLYLNHLLVAGLIMATEPLLAVLMLGHLDVAPWQYGLAFAVPCLGGLVGSRLAHRVVARYGRSRVLRTVGALRAVWLIGLAFVTPGTPGLLTVIAIELAIIVSMSLYNPVVATYRLQHTPDDRIARTLTAWSVGSGVAIATLTALGGLLAAVTGPRVAIAVAGALILASPLLLRGRTFAG
jgi:MFS family permease